MSNTKFIFVVAFVLVFGAVIAASTAVFAKSEKVRVVAETEDQVSQAIDAGCKVVRKAKELRALECPADAAFQLGLQEDVRVFIQDEDSQKEVKKNAIRQRVFAQDIGANKQIGADLVQASGNTGSGRKIVIIDTGYNYTHPELSSSFLGGKDFVNNDDDPMDDNGHGSHVAGLITGDGIDPKAKGVAPDAGIISAKVLNASGSGYFSDVIAAIYWAVDGPDGISGTGDEFGADAISMSLGTGAPYLYKNFCDGVYPAMTNAIKYGVDHGIAVVVAAGNSGNAGVSLPGCISYSTTVGAVNKYDQIASFSGRGKAVDIVAPGVSLYSAWLGSSYYTASGTSMATPVISAVVALIKYAHPAYLVSQVENSLFKTAKDLGTLGKDKAYGWGRVVADKAVAY